MRHSIVTINGMKWWKTETGLDTEFEPVEVQPREVTVRLLRNGEWRLERVYSYARSTRDKREIRITSARYVKEDVVFAAARRFLENRNTKYE